MPEGPQRRLQPTLEPLHAGPLPPCTPVPSPR